MALMAPAAIGLAIVILFLGRGVDNRATMQVSAETGAQAAAQERTMAGAQAAGRSAALAMMIDEDTCSNPHVEVDTAQFRPGGIVSVTVSCTVSTAGLELINPPNGTGKPATAYATIDPLRGAEGEP
jgi:hypothetical protein